VSAFQNHVRIGLGIRRLQRIYFVHVAVAAIIISHHGDGEYLVTTYIGQ
jgi:hypothetical protein